MCAGTLARQRAVPGPGGAGENRRGALSDRVQIRAAVQTPPQTLDSELFRSVGRSFL
jgi:hypothetical protein